MYKILLIEEDTVLRKRIKKFLENSNFKIFTSGDGENVIELVTEILPDVILCDTKLSRKSGYEILKDISKLPGTASIIFIFLTDESSLNDMRNIMALGADDFLIKPFDNKDLLNTIILRLEKRLSLKKIFKYDLENFENTRNGDKNQYEHIFLNVNHKPHLVKIKEIICLKAEGEYSKVFLSNGNVITICKSLKKWETILPQKIFVRTHRSTIINLDYIEKIERWYKRSYRVYVKNHKESFMVSQRYASKLKGDILF